ncbi:AbrB/MazE/SpoVT family DNA-binding domain-containing protein [Candidatus Tisiphia endosymbiont of Nemotelus uliginosus]|uniref:AbrB/MazE/SpoVT family DNA-binding domain-containing protein n=1 Tax=Candidatus Tisiphia endosymbiont of Nemotelus uliginosus TaxID=3077926 RepID=UPI0035C8D140
MYLEYKVTIGENGRLIIPAKIREHCAISSGDQLMLVLSEELKIIPIKNMVHKFQSFIKSRNKNNISLVNSLKESRLEEYNNE